MTIKRFSGTFKTRDDVFDNITPNNVVQPNVSVPAGEWKPAAWLPIAWQGTASEDYFVISSGKVVAMDRTGRIVPAGLRIQIESISADGDTVLTYSSLDVEHGTIDIRTGDAVTAADSVTLKEFADAILDFGWVLESEMQNWESGNTDYYDGTVTDEVLDAVQVAQAFISEPVGICAYDVYAWAGDSAAELNFVNYQKQHLVQFFTDMQLQMPMITAGQSTSGALDSGTASAWSGGGAAATDGNIFPDADLTGGELFLSSAQLSGLARYEGLVSSGDHILGFQMRNLPAAEDTDRSPVEDHGGTGFLVRKRTSPLKVTKTGDYFWDAAVGILMVYDSDETGGVTNNLGTGDQLDYYSYANASIADAHRHIHLGGLAYPGDFVTFDRQSNLTVVRDDAQLASGPTAATVQGRVLGRVLAVIDQPKGLLDRVRTAWSGSSFDKSAQMPGSATKGFTDLLTLSDQDVGGKLAVVNIKIQ